MVEQVRLWFYSQLFFSVVLTGKAPYRANGSHAAVLAAPGEEFHKTGANMLDLGESCEEVGADVIRWLYARQNPQENVYWGSAPTDDIKRRLLTLWNTYSFFVTYANLDAFDPNAAEVSVARRPLIDRWLLSALARLVRDCRDSLDRHDSATAAYKMEAFWEDLSTWYVRRNRRRFWQAASRADSLAAYQTLYTALTTLARLFAPMMPFLAESMYQNLVRNARNDAEASVHHTAYPTVREEWIDDALDRRMRAAMRVVALGRAARSAAGVKTRTPLAKLIAVFDAGDRDHGALDGQGDLATLICDELNVKAFEVRDHAAGLVREVVKPELKALGPKLGKDLPRVRAALQAGTYTVVDGSTHVLGFVLSPDEVLVSHEGTPGHTVGKDPGAVVALETTLTPDLEAEGLARELVRKVNDLRKDAGFEIADRIALRYGGAIAPTIERFAELVRGEALATSLSQGLSGRGHVWRGELNGIATELELEKISKT